MSKCRYELSTDCNNTDCLNCVLDKIRAEMENKISSDTDNIVLTQKFNEGLITSIAIIDKYRKGQTDADSD